MKRMMYFEMLRTREDSSSWKVMRSVSSLALVGLKQEMLVALGLPLKVATVILGCVFSMLFSDFRTHGPISVPTPTTVALTKLFHADAVASVYPLP